MPKPSIARLPADGCALLFAAALTTTLAAPSHAQDKLTYAHALTTWIAVPATPGNEDQATGRIQSATRGFARDALGNLVRRVGSGKPRRVLACGIDEVGYAVSEITDEGYLRVHPAGNGRRGALWDQFHEGQRVYVVGHAGDVERYIPGVVGVRSTHLWRRRSAEDTPAGVEDLWIDIGARSRADVAHLGIQILDAVHREWPSWTFADHVAGPGAANRASCAAIVAASQAAAPKSGETIFVVSTQSRFNFTGLSAVLARLGQIDTLIVLDEALARAGTMLAGPRASPWSAMPRVQVTTSLAAVPQTRWTGTLVESISEEDLRDLFTTVARLAGIPGTPPPIMLARVWAPPPPSVLHDSLSRYADLLGRLADVYGVAGHEAAMRDAVKEALPAWARDSVVTDSAGNLYLAMGPDRDTTVFVAHMDEVGFEVSHIAKDGTVSLRTRGGFFESLWEGQTALLHRNDDKIPARDARSCGAAREGPLRGVFVPRDSAPHKQPTQLTAWFGLDSAALVKAGVTIGDAVTSYKCSARLATTRFTARSIDDRAGDTAMLIALESIERAKLDHKVIFAWSVREESGLEGARGLAAEFGPSVSRVYAIDTFVSSDSPLESSRFADAKLGEGAVARALDNSSVTPPEEVDRITRLARINRIPLQVGTTNGGNDGSELAHYGALDDPLGWPSRYSHSPAELLDLRDIHSLSRIIAALAMTGGGAR
ncbi:MAG TPA: M20/M25/M40 family metallo-hydrolase [Gemmatimonadaceae bacterium]